ncbi:MAG: DNA-directed RNA polymerase subunit P [Candidatus Parvarchaeota archaeon]|nr:DNA-directed RNA polymerase subunit P [Candidatus Jingweiarchaeum tengchongense]MCW1298307.1 DNA-directed RNA polymerase subunit P [Candidatus Jingweiarchaeum tengchongense]MCW1300398.1 DNA-directed RNA polymerase subunit P [Candidatus Jingweiarchaeum tengchongense]MCW1304757.1 DNA-directed RNA polymerase subunit P [Candidatus Jingweiarchaeum tengchongense]MCW1305347.1 DNA-directed RNA polymerase subunit P [Candidatus Jingweiarchaeum tengchongense]
MEYVCFKCKKTVEYKSIKKRPRCPYCGGKIFFKKRPDIIKRVEAV